MEPFIINNKESFSLNAWTEHQPALAAGFSTKTGGVSSGEFSGLNFGFHVGDNEHSVCQNRSILAEKIGFKLDSWVGAEQTHEIHIQRVTAADRGKGAEQYKASFRQTDGFYTDEKGILLTLCFADCVPLYFLDRNTGLIGLAHAGWKGTVGGIGREMISLFAQNGSRKQDILAVIGPSICKKCYIVDNRVITFVEKILEGVEKKPYNQISEGQYALDLKLLNKQILMNSGIREENIQVTDYCTSCDSEFFYSHRRDKGATGRMVAFIGWKEDLQP
jgi:polyphenol oxidase